MSKRRLKLIIWAGLAVIALVFAFWVVQSVASLVAYFQQGADPAAALNLVPNIPLDLAVSLEWLPDDDDTGRMMDPATRTQIESAYLRAWLQWNLSYDKGEPYGLKTYFVGPAQAAISDAVTQAALSGWEVAQVDLRHQLRLHFYAADGSIVSFSDENAEVAQIIGDGSGKALFAGTTAATYDVIMFLEDGNWRIRHWVRRPPVESESVVKHSFSFPEFVSTKDAQLMLGDRAFRIAGFNYYPQQTPWLEFWTEYDAEVTRQDLELMRSLGMNTVRIFVPFHLFGGAKIEAEYLAKLQDFLDQAQGENLKVIVTLFDFRTDYNLLLWPEADRHLETLLRTFRDHPAILAWDLKNEPDLDYSANGPEIVNAWLAHMLSEARRYDPNHLLTIGWSSVEAAPTLADEVDIVSFHDFLPAHDLITRLASLRAAAPSRPLLLEEYGMSTWSGGLLIGHTESEQSAYYAQVLEAVRTSDTVGSLAWTLFDFTHVPRQIAGLAPWRRGRQGRFGVIRTDGSPKPAASVITADTSTHVLTAP